MDLEIDKRYTVVTPCSRNIYRMEAEINHSTEIGKTILSLGAIFAVVFAFWQIQNGVRDDIRPELQDLRTDVRKIEEKLNLVLGQQDIVLRKLNLGK